MTQTITLDTETALVFTTAIVRGNLALHKTIEAGWPWSLSHVPTGRIIARFRTSCAALRALIALNRLGDWRFDDPDAAQRQPYARAAVWACNAEHHRERRGDIWLYDESA